jgi:hypothetical protein
LWNVSILPIALGRLILVIASGVGGFQFSIQIGIVEAADMFDFDQI